MRHRAGAVLVVSLSTVCMFAQQQASTESEFGADGSGKWFSSQYLFYSYNRPDRRVGISSLARHFYSAGTANRGEFAAGPNLRFEKGGIDTYVGGTTDRRILLAMVGVVALPGGLTAILISDPKLTLDGSHQSTWFRKVWLGRGHFHLRWEDLYVQRAGVVFGRIGPEGRVRLVKRCELFVAPFFDYISGKAAVQGGMRLTLK